MSEVSNGTLTGEVEEKPSVTGGIATFLGKDGESAYDIAVKNGFAGTEEEWLESLKGETGDQGEKGEQGEQGEKGDKGDTGTAATVTVGTVTTGEPGDKAEVNNSGTQVDAVFNFVIPKGDKGDPMEAYVSGENLIFVSSVEAKVSRVEKNSEDTYVTLYPNIFYVFPEMASLSVTLDVPLDTGFVCEYKFRFVSGETATTLTLPDTVIGDITIEASKVYEISIIDGYLVYQSWAVS